MNQSATSQNARCHPYARAPAQHVVVWRAIIQRLCCRSHRPLFFRCHRDSVFHVRGWPPVSRVGRADHFSGPSKNIAIRPVRICVIAYNCSLVIAHWQGDFGVYPYYIDTHCFFPPNVGGVVAEEPPPNSPPRSFPRFVVALARIPRARSLIPGICRLDELHAPAGG